MAKVVVNFGGDHPDVIMGGVLDAIGAKTKDLQLIISADPLELSNLYQFGSSERDAIARAMVVEPPVKYKDLPTEEAALAWALELLREEKLDALITPTNSKTLFYHWARAGLGVTGIKRPLLIGPMPTSRIHEMDSGLSWVGDIGAVTSTSDPEVFLGWLQVATTFLQDERGYKVVRVALGHIATEKGRDPELDAVFDYLAKRADNFVGYCEPANFFDGAVDVVLSDSRRGNYFLKAVEGCGKQILKELLEQVFRGDEAGAKRVMRFFAGRYAYARFGLARMLGSQGKIYRMHGGAKRPEVAEAIPKVLRHLGGLPL